MSLRARVSAADLERQDRALTREGRVRKLAALGSTTEPSSVYTTSE